MACRHPMIRIIRSETASAKGKRIWDTRWGDVLLMSLLMLLMAMSGRFWQILAVDRLSGAGPAVQFIQRERKRRNEIAHEIRHFGWSMDSI